MKTRQIGKGNKTYIIAEIGLNHNNSYVVASMKDESLYFFEYDYNDKNLSTPNKVRDGNAENIKIERVHSFY